MRFTVEHNVFYDLEELILVHFGQTGFISAPPGTSQDGFRPGRGIQTKGVGIRGGGIGHDRRTENRKAGAIG